MKINKHGENTVQIVKELKIEGHEVFYDHGRRGEDPDVGVIASTIGENSRENQLSHLDIAIVQQGSRKAIALVEIEETSDTPKSFLGDIFGFLLGRYIYNKRERLEIGNFTTLVLVGISASDHYNRNRYIQEQANAIRASLGTGNARIGKVVLKTYNNEQEMLHELPLYLEELVKG